MEEALAFDSGFTRHCKYTSPLHTPHTHVCAFCTSLSHSIPPITLIVMGKTVLLAVKLSVNDDQWSRALNCQ